MMEAKTLKSVQNQMNYVAPAVKESMGYVMMQEPFYQWVRDHVAELDKPLIKALASNLRPFKRVGEEVVEGLASTLSQLENTEELVEFLRNSLSKGELIPLPASYDVLTQLGYTGEVKPGSPAESVAKNVSMIAFNNRGLSLNEKGKLVLNANVFASYVLTRINLVQLEKGGILAYDHKGHYKEISERLLKTICRDILHEAQENIWKRKWETEYFEALKREIEYVECMNSETEYINLTNGMLNLYSKELVEHSPRFLSTIQIPFEYKEEATCPTFKKFLFDIFEGDGERVRLVQELIGYCFLHEIKIQKAFIFVGPGSNGKSVLAEIIRQLIGIPNVSNVALNDLGGRFGMQNLPGKLVNISSENEFNKKFNTQNFKMLTGGDAVNVEQKYRDSFNTVLFTKIIILLNRMMDSDDMSNGYYRRLGVIPFNKIYREIKANETPKEGVDYMDKNLTDKLLKELPGILIFALEGLTRLISNDFNMTESQVCERALEDYKSKQNPIIEYFNNRVQVSPGHTTLRPNFRKDFSQWASTNGYEDERLMGATRFWELFKKVLDENNISLREKKINGDIYVEGLQIVLNTTSDDYVDPC
ncbi:phage/plasmid primase, P4 family [Bacillus sp. B1-b2]|uniref:DNA primase family protein n=1 Tax=Bacillus sp. B1-b2 TaxID=2653201 RepID=UPI00126153EE|nr:DNA primase family protein [Bacillus sp. B1-b2]KAB7666040.1 hypothetical protein F9279_18660 [Bacillus sp. B1-b2]